MSSKARRRVVVGALVPIATTLAGLVGCAWFMHSGLAWPTHDESTLKAIRAESVLLIKTEPIGGQDNVDVPKNRWPRVIASLNPYFVTVFRDGGVDIMVRPAMDGGYGYFVPRNERDKPDWGQPITDLGYGVFWYTPG